MGQKQQPQQQGAGNKSNYMKLYEHFGQKQSFSEIPKSKKLIIENEKQKSRAFYIDILILIILFNIFVSPESLRFTKKLGLKGFRTQMFAHSVLFGLAYYLKTKYID
jgi:hypothetical protein